MILCKLLRIDSAEAEHLRFPIQRETCLVFGFFYPTFEIINPLFQNVISIVLQHFLLVSIMFEFNQIIMLQYSFYRYKIESP